MRETKFRIRNATTKEVVAYELIGIPFNFGYAFYFTNDDKKTYHPNSNELFRVCGILCPIRDQFTGLQDVTGKDIYEGDIVELSPKEYICLVEYTVRDARFILKNKNGDKGEFALIASAIKVIGNIYENPELLQ